MTKKPALLLIVLVLAASSAFGADYDRSEKTPLYEARLRVPAAAMEIAPLKDRIVSLYRKDVAGIKEEAKDDQDGNKDFHPYFLDTRWRTTFENPAVLSLSAEVYVDNGGAHPNSAFETIVWDKRHARAVPLEALFAPGRRRPRYPPLPKRPRRRGQGCTSRRPVKIRDPIRTSPLRESDPIRRSLRTTR